MKATDCQVVGDHYQRLPYQPIELAARLELNFFQGNILKYLARHRYKGGAADLNKAIHYARLAEQYDPEDGFTLAEENRRDVLAETYGFVDRNGLDLREALVLSTLISQHWPLCAAALEVLKEEHYGKQPTNKQ